MGENQLRALPELLMTSPMPRTSTATASAAIAAPVAVRACRHSCAVTAATAPNTMATPVMPRHIAAVSTTRKPVEAIASVMVTASTAFTPPTRISAAYVRAYRPTTDDSTSSAMPLSSSARVCRMTVVMARIDAATMSVSISSLAIIAPRSVSLPPNMGPPNIIPAGVLSRLTRASRCASSG